VDKLRTKLNCIRSQLHEGSFVLFYLVLHDVTCNLALPYVEASHREGSIVRASQPWSSTAI